ncbi:MAG TPA: amino acid transporter [Dehalococcoidia bacterium]|nr:amino acid transporter [Dehalococcoidia bacterium]
MMTAGDVLEVLDALEAAGIAPWLDGGWAVDALLGEETREHDDLDLVVRDEDVQRAVSALSRAGFAMQLDDRPTRFVLAAAGGRRIDFHPVVFSETGDALQKGAGPNGGDARFPASGFTGGGAVAGRPVSTLSPDLLVLFHTGYEPQAKDRHNVRRLCERFEITLPEAYR